MVYWESLGDAYAARGSYNSAIRVFQKILELSPDNSYALLQIASIKTVRRASTKIFFLLFLQVFQIGRFFICLIYSIKNPPRLVLKTFS